MSKNKEQLEKFIAQCLAAKSLDFPDVAYTIGLSWSRDVKPELKEPWFREAMEEMLEKFKYSLVQKIHTIASKGVLNGGPPPAVAHIKELIKLIDSGVLLGSVDTEEDTTKGLSPEEELRHKKRLGIT